ncbi:hypothetical protein QYM36_004377 [Artemia franciscana]|uniref:MoaB/Mog domain-containing protein n=1 Tax=Artemia franciscana TaxID=6661 RepID=A0AA88IER1_ARTSF|nr:hypothetical protein QYM36_004377 [Artemia franciscana]
MGQSEYSNMLLNRLKLRLKSLTLLPKRAIMSTKNTVVIIVTGDEILKGQTQDTNSHFLCQRLYKLGVKVGKISTISDDIDEIASEVKDFSQRIQYVITPGGIGPTHDDITLEGIAKAFNEKLILYLEYCTFFIDYVLANRNSDGKYKSIRNKDLLNMNAEEVKNLVSEFPVFKMALLPESTQPQFLRNESSELVSKFPIAQLDEVSMAGILNRAVVQFFGRIIFGSYPKVDHSYYGTKVTLEAKAEKDMQEGHEYLMKNLPENAVVHYDTNPFEDAWDKLQKIIELQDLHFQKLVKNSIEGKPKLLAYYVGILSKSDRNTLKIKTWTLKHIWSITL